jgi:hypothetical protein
MDIKMFSPEIEEYIDLLIKRKVVSSDSKNDKMLINFLSTQRIDKDYFYVPAVSFRKSLCEAC